MTEALALPVEGGGAATFVAAYRAMASDKRSVRVLDGAAIAQAAQLVDHDRDTLLVLPVADGPTATLSEMTAADFFRAMEVALRTPWQAVQHLLTHLPKLPLMVIAPAMTGVDQGACSSATTALEFLIRSEAAAGARIGFGLSDDPIGAAAEALTLHQIGGVGSTLPVRPLRSIGSIAPSNAGGRGVATRAHEGPRRVLITGGGGEIARALGEALVRQGGKVQLLLIDRDEGRLADAATALRGATVQVETLAGDLAEPLTVEAGVALAEQSFGGLDAVFAHAGIAAGERAKDISLDHFDLLFAVNLFSSWSLARAAFPLLAQSGGTLTFTSSIGGLRPGLSAPVYSASKAALLRLTEWFAIEWAPRGVRVNAVSPGSTLTPMNRLWNADETSRSAAVASYPLQRMAEPAEIAAAMAFLASPAASYISGHNLVVDGALSRLAPHG